jgi:hypothetical protein
MVVIAWCVWMLSVASEAPQMLEKVPASPTPAASVQPVLIDVNDLFVVVDARRYPKADPNGLKFASQLESAVQARLEKAKIRVQEKAGEASASASEARLSASRGRIGDANAVRTRRPDAPVLHVALNVLVPEGGSRAVLYVQTSLTRSVRLVDTRKAQPFSVSIWDAEPAMDFVSPTRWQDEARRIILQQVDSFIAAPRSVAGAAAPILSSSYVAFKTGTEFHRPDCAVARTIDAENMVSFKTREEALEAGKRPCKACNP